jgi:peptidoglycan/xylan/chitin deacetylase (PgdA/CDA1 family)
VRRVALTIDTEHPDRPARPGNVERILDTLAVTGTRATFFVQGRWAEAYPGLARRIAAEGHVVGNHGRAHVSLRMLSDDGVREMVSHAETTIQRVTGVDPKPWFRSPHDDVTEDRSITDLLAQLGYRQVGWSVNPCDWDAGCTAQDVARGVVDGCSEVGDGAVVLLHSWPDATADSLPGIIETLRAGSKLVAVDAL